MVAGLLKFKEYFKDYSDSYVLIGGAACDILFTENEAAFRATRDLDMVLIVEALTPEFAGIFRNFIKDGDYRHISGSTGKPQFYRFDKPQVEGFPKMIELFSRTDFELKSHIGITPLHVSDDISSLSAILLDDDYYKVLLNGRVIENGFSVLRPEYLILFKAKAYLDLSSRKAKGEKVDSADIKKHKKDVLRLAVEMVLNPVSDLPESVMEDIRHFINNLREDEFDQNSLKTYRVTNDQAVSRLISVFEA
ncbi:hypothetical protein [Lachnospira multipara]|uniref:Nucleotidyl transferase AbiEii toxin, Type IV TA system n=1 Tax=Lachnospira multipara TaxID=28051 RepID=A0A1H5WZK0_9FIRM|nr:hypothetical protein [Lachnospira multipara]SEG04962.1 hypothetical protein SAMN05216537_12014 [Lachnospira multipara]